MAKVDRIRTPLTEIEIADALRVGHDRVLARPDDGEAFERRMGVAWAQSMLELGRGRACWCNNFGNVTVPHDWIGDFYELTTDEQVRPGEWRPLALRYGAFAAPEDGAENYWLLFVEGHRYAPCLSLFDAGDAIGAAHRLHDLGFYTANAEPYARAMNGLYNEWQARRP